MSNCLDEARIQAVADGEAPDSDVRHANACAVCRARVLAAREAASEFARAMTSLAVPSHLDAKVRETLARSAQASGATTLREVPRRRPAWLVAGGALAATIALIVFVLWPSVDSGTRVSAAEILDKSIASLAGHGTERLVYELEVTGPALPTGERGAFLIEQLVDHDNGRWRMARYGADRSLLNGITEDPTIGTRTALIQHEGQTYRFTFHITESQRVPLWDVQRRYAETMIRLVQASTAGQVVTTETSVDGPQYVVELPDNVSRDAGTAALFDVDRARVVVNAADYHIVEFSMTGQAMGEPMAIAYRLIQRDLMGSPLPSRAFALAPDVTDAIELEGNGSDAPPLDVLGLLLRQVAQMKR